MLVSFGLPAILALTLPSSIEEEVGSHADGCGRLLGGCLCVRTREHFESCTTVVWNGIRCGAVSVFGDDYIVGVTPVIER
jgi:hypothetical protein